MNSTAIFVNETTTPYSYLYDFTGITFKYLIQISILLVAIVSCIRIAIHFILEGIEYILSYIKIVSIILKELITLAAFIYYGRYCINRLSIDLAVF
jgi:hypothetical protein